MTGTTIDELLAVGKGMELDPVAEIEVPGTVVLLRPVTGEPGVLLLLTPVEYVP